MEFKLKINEAQGTVYIPKKIREAFGHELTLVANTAAIVLIPTGTSLADIVESLKIIVHDLKLKAKIRKRRLTLKEADS